MTDHRLRDGAIAAIEGSLNHDRDESDGTASAGRTCIDILPDDLGRTFTLFGNRCTLLEAYWSGSAHQISQDGGIAIAFRGKPSSATVAVRQDARATDGPTPHLPDDTVALPVSERRWTRDRRDAGTWRRISPRRG